MADIKEMIQGSYKENIVRRGGFQPCEGDKNMEDIGEIIYGCIDFVYRCKKCAQRFPIYWVSDSDWRKSGFGTKTICKKCFEKRVPEPHYCTLDEYVEKRINTRGTPKYVVENTRRMLNHIWNMPSEKDWLES